MPLRVTVDDYVVNTDQTVTVTYTVTWLGATGQVVWQQPQTLNASAQATRDDILSAIQQSALQAAQSLTAVEAALGLAAVTGRTYEYDAAQRRWRQLQ